MLPTLKLSLLLFCGALLLGVDEWIKSRNSTAVYINTQWNFRLRKPAEDWVFYSNFKGRQSPLVGLDTPEPSSFSPRIKIFAHDWDNAEYANECPRLREKAKSLFESSVWQGAQGHLIWLEEDSPYYGGVEVCESIGEIRRGGVTVAYARLVSLPLGEHQYIFSLLCSPEERIL
jgi:hypothetical protein